MIFPTTFDHTEYTTTIGGRVYPNVGGNLSTIANWILSHYNIKTIKKSDIIYIWNGTYYEDGLISELSTMIEAMYIAAGFKYTPSFANGILSIIRSRTAVDGETLNSDRDIIPFLNGWYRISARKMIEPDPSIFISYIIPHNYNPSAECPVFKRFIKDVLPDINNRVLLLRYMAYILTPRINIGKSMILYGRGANGKTKIAEIIINMLGDRLYSQIPLQMLGDRFNQVVYMGKLANIADDIPNAGLHDDSFIKMLITGEKLNGEIKGKQPFNYTNTCKLFSTCNQIPEPVKTVSDGFYRRWIIIPFLKEFRGKNDDINLVDKLKLEIEGIIFYIMKYLHSIDKLVYFDRDDAKRLWVLYGNPAISFHSGCLFTNTPRSTKKTWVYTCFIKWCDIYNLNTISQREFNDKLSNLGVKSGKNSSGEWVYTNCEMVFDDKEAKRMGIEETESGYYRLARSI
jgi:putative DNA primase/helicase